MRIQYVNSLMSDMPPSFRQIAVNQTILGQKHGRASVCRITSKNGPELPIRAPLDRWEIVPFVPFPEQSLCLSDTFL